MNLDVDRGSSLPKLPTGITSFDLIAEGSIPKNRTTLISGTAGSAKTDLRALFGRSIRTGAVGTGERVWAAASSVGWWSFFAELSRW